MASFLSFFTLTYTIFWICILWILNHAVHLKRKFKGNGDVEGGVEEGAIVAKSFSSMDFSLTVDGIEWHCFETLRNTRENASEGIEILHLF